MHRCIPLLILLALLLGCVSPADRQAGRDQQKALKSDQNRLHNIYRSSFERGFLDGWAGRHAIDDTTGLVGHPTHPEGERALHEGWIDGQKAGLKARLTWEGQSLTARQRRQ